MKVIKNKNKITIRNKLLLYFSLLILMTVVAQLIFNLFLADELFTLYKKNYMEDAFYQLKEAYDGSSETMEELASEMEDSENIQIVITNETEEIYITYTATVDIESSDVMNGIYSVGIDGRYSNAPKAKEVIIPSDSGEIIELAGSFEYEGEEIHIRMSLPVASINSTSSFYTNANIVIGIIILILGIILALRVSRSITKPIVDIEKISHDLSNLEFVEYASEESGTKEIASLGQSINRMSRELESRIIELNCANDKLKKDVDYQLQAEQMRKEFIANVSHEMKTPLAILQFYCENLKSDFEGIDKDYYLDTIIEETKRMDEMVKSMVALSSLENGLDKMEFNEVDISELTHHLVEKMTPLLEAYKVEINIGEKLRVIGDGRYLEQAMKNYITNAVTHTKEGEIIRITLEQIGADVKFTVFNKGELIDEIHAERIWESFYKSDKARVRTDHSNVGLGLHIVKCIVENHKGNYGVESKEDGVSFFFGILAI